MKTRLPTACVLGVILFAARLPGGFAQSGHQPETSSPGVVSAAIAPAKAASAPDGVSSSAAAGSARLSPWTAEIVKLAQAGIEEGVLLAFIDSAGTFNLGADQIIHLSDLGVPSQMITAMLQHDLEVASGLRPLVTLAVPASAPTIRMTLAARADASSKVGASAATTPAPSVLAQSRFAGLATEEFLPEVSFASAALEPAQWETTGAAALDPGRPAALHQQDAVPEARGRRYPVRAPYAVELAPPILIVNGAGRAPNVVVIEMFPAAAR